jgi:hypothetical protein
MRLLEQFLPGAVHLGCAAAKEEACALIICRSELKCGDAKHTLQHARDEVLGFVCRMCVEGYVCVCTREVPNITCSYF